jgi:hypothetical protein
MQKYPETFILLHSHSLKPKVEFPLIIQMFSFTSIIVTQLRTEKLYFICNKLKSVLLACNQAYCAILLKFMEWYISEQSTIVNMDALNKRLKADIASIGIVKIWEKLPSDQQFVNIII